MTMGEAIEDARGAVPSGSRLVSISIPEASEKGSAYEVWFAHGVDTYAYATTRVTTASTSTPATAAPRTALPQPGERHGHQQLVQNWAGPIHMGTLVGWLPRTGWILFGLTPLLLAVTGTVTWVMRRRMGKRKKRRDRDRDGGARPGAPSPVGVPAGVGS